MTYLMADLVIPWTHRLVALGLAGFVLAIVVELIRRRKLREEYAMLWLGTSVMLLIVAVFPQIAYGLSSELGISYLTLMLLGVFVFLVMILMHYATVISRQSEHIRQLAQQIALLKERLRQREEGEEDEDSEASD